MSVHVRYQTPEDVSNKIYELVQACNGGRLKRGSNEVTKVALRKTAAFVVLAEDVNPPELVNHIHSSAAKPSIRARNPGLHEVFTSKLTSKSTSSP